MSNGMYYVHQHLFIKKLSLILENQLYKYFKCEWEQNTSLSLMLSSKVNLWKNIGRAQHNMEN